VHHIGCSLVIGAVTWVLARVHHIGFSLVIGAVTWVLAGVHHIGCSLVIGAVTWVLAGVLISTITFGKTERKRKVIFLRAQVLMNYIVLYLSSYCN
jgi:cell division protein FtsW (lipid II flippase)